MGIFFHELDTYFSKHGTQCWQKQVSISSRELLKGQFMQDNRQTHRRINLQLSLTDNKILLINQDQIQSLQFSLTALEQRFYLENGRKVYEFRLMKDDMQTTIFTYNENIFIDFYSHMAKYCIMKNFQRHFRVSKQLGQGSFSVVYEGKSIHSNYEVALKVFDKKKLLQIEDGINILKNQIVNLEKLKQFSLSPLIQAFQTQDCVILVLKKAQCGHMLDYIKQHAQQYDAEMAKNIMKKVFQNLQSLHSAGFIHRDIKPENILFDNHLNSFHLFLSDFGLSVQKICSKNSIGKKCSGTLGFVAPEVIHDNQYDQKCDIFSAGCLLYFLLTGKKIFSNMSIQEILLKTYANDFIHRKIDHLPEQYSCVKELLKGLLQVNPQKRMSAQNALNHRFFRSQQQRINRNLNKLCGQDLFEHIRQYISKKVVNFWR